MRKLFGVLLIGLVFSACADTRVAENEDGAREGFRELFSRGYYPGRSGQIFFILEPGEILLRRPMGRYRFMHGGPWVYDRDIPLFFYGPGVIGSGTREEPAHQQDIAPSLLSLVDVPPSATMTGRDLTLSRSEERPRAIVVVVLDGMRKDYFERYGDGLPTLTRMAREGLRFEHASVNYLPTVTSAGHTTIATGADPNRHGISGNGYFDRRSGETRTLFEGMRPDNVMVPGLADVWATTLGPDAVVVAQGTTPRATVSLAGHGRCQPNGRAVAMAMFDYRSASFVTARDCYVLPTYLEPLDARPIWERSEREYRDLQLATGRDFVTTDLFPSFQVDALLAMLEGESIGKDEVPDLVLVNMKTPDYVGHFYGPESEEMRHALEAIDRQLSRVLDALEASAGEGRFVVAVTADHGMPSEPSHGERRFIRELNDAVLDTLDPDARTLLHEYLDTANLQLYVDRARMAELGIDLRDIAATVEALPYIRAAFTEDDIRSVR